MSETNTESNVEGVLTELDITDADSDSDTYAEDDRTEVSDPPQVISHSSERSSHVSRDTVESILVVYMVGAMIVMSILKHRGSDLHTEAREHGNTDILAFVTEKTITLSMKVKIRKVLPLIGIVLFYILGSFLDMTRVVSYLYCMYDDGFQQRFLVGGIFRVVRLGFMGALMLFCITFHSRVFVQCALGNLSLFCLMGATITMWFDSTLIESFNLPIDSESCNLTADNSPDGYIHVTSNYLCPINIEFFLLIMETILHLMLTRDTMQIIKNGNQSDRTVLDQPGGDSEDQLDLSRSGISESQDLNSSRCCFRCESNIEDLGLNADGANSSTHSPANPCATKFRNWCVCSRSMAFCLGLLPNIVFITLGIMTYKDTLSFTWGRWFMYYKIFYWIHAIIICAIGYHVVIDFDTKSEEFHVLEMMVVLSMFGAALHIFFSLVAAIGSILKSHKNDLAWLLLTDVTFNMVALFFQTGFMVYASRVVLPFAAYTTSPGHHNLSGMTGNIHVQRSSIQSDTVDEAAAAAAATTTTTTTTTTKATENTIQTANTPTSILRITSELDSDTLSDDENTMDIDLNLIESESPHRKRDIFLNIILYLIVCNLTMWLVDSFVEMKNFDLGMVSEHYFGSHIWHMIFHISMPLILFYRFNSFILFSEIYLDH